MFGLKPLWYPTLRSRVLHNSLVRHQLFILILTFVIYAMWHASRKPLSIVKTVFHPQCDPKNSNYEGNKHWCQWKPFDTDEWSRLVGTLECAFLISYAVAMFPCGYLAERINLRTFLSLGMALSGLSVVAFGLGYYLDIHVYSYYLFVQIFSGIVQASGWPAIVAVFSNWLGKERRGFVMGIWNANTNIGNAIGSFLAGSFISWNWGASFIIPGLLMLPFALILMLVLVERPTTQLQLVGPSWLSTSTGDSVDGVKLNLRPYDHLHTSHRKRQVSQTIDPIYRSDSKEMLHGLIDGFERPISFLDAFMLPNVRPYALALFFLKLVTSTFLYWLPNYLSITSLENFTVETAAIVSTVFDVGGVFGGIIAGFISDGSLDSSSSFVQDISLRTVYLRALTCSGMLVLAAPSLMLYAKIGASTSFLSLGLLFACGAFATGPCALIVTAVSADLGTQSCLMGNARALATVTSIIDGTGSLGAALGPFLTGLLIPFGWDVVFNMLIVSELLALFTTTYIVIQTRDSGTKIMHLSSLG